MNALTTAVVMSLSATLVMLLIVGMLKVATEAGPNCPAPIPAEWLGYCADYDLR